MADIKNKIIILIILVFIAGNLSPAAYQKYTYTTYAMGTVLTVMFFSDDKEKAKDLLNKCFVIADELENKMSCKIDTSLISKLNKSKDMVIDDAIVLDVLKDSIKYAKETGDSFDPALFNLTDLWGIEKGNNKPPERSKIEAVLLSCGYRNAVIDNNRVVLKNNIAFDLGAIAKVRIIGEIGDFLKQNGIKDFLVNGGGDIYLGGKYENKRLWKVAVVDPFAKNDFLGVFELTDCAIITSGDYERNFTDNGILYHHIMDPKTGYPVWNDVHSVTLIFDRPGSAKDIAKGFGTALFVMGKDRGLQFISKYPDIGLLYVMGKEGKEDIFYTQNIGAEKNKEGKWDFVFKPMMERERNFKENKENPENKPVLK
jgi:FAD:protein FMN transferase